MCVGPVQGGEQEAAGCSRAPAQSPHVSRLPSCSDEAELTLAAISDSLCMCGRWDTRVVCGGRPAGAGGWWRLHLGRRGAPNTHTHTPHLPLINHQRFTAVHLPVWVPGWGEGDSMGVMRVRFIFSLAGTEECVNGATTSSPSSHQPLIHSPEWEAWRWVEPCDLCRDKCCLLMIYDMVCALCGAQWRVWTRTGPG